MAKLPRASPNTVIRKDRRATVSKYNQTPFCILSNPAYGDLSEGLPNRFPTLSIYLPHADNAMRLKINAAMKYRTEMRTISKLRLMLSLKRISLPTMV